MVQGRGSASVAVKTGAFLFLPHNYEDAETHIFTEVSFFANNPRIFNNS